jgi:hypothetical protein
VEFACGFHSGKLTCIELPAKRGLAREKSIITLVNAPTTREVGVKLKLFNIPVEAVR